MAARMGADELQRRVARQNLHYTSKAVRAKRFLSRQLVKIAAEWFFFLTGLSPVGRRNFRDIQVRTEPIVCPKRPLELKGLRLLQISDLHLDLDPGLAEVVVERLDGITADAALLTGDFRNATYGDFHPALEQTRKIIEALSMPAFGILGNHDYIEMVPGLEEMGVRMLINEAVRVEAGGGSFWMAGIDDPHLYQTHNLARACREIPEDAFSILLSHSPETYAEAAAHGFDAFFCGHTHGGQICWPGGTPILTHCPAPRRCARGPWVEGAMQGYTTTGTGGCGTALRFHCPPEIVIHVFQ